MNTNTLRRTLGIAVLLAPWPAAAQDVETPSGNIPGWSVTPGVSVGAVYDSNVALSNTPSGSGDTQSDRLFVVQPSARLGFLSPRTSFSSGYSGYVRRYMELDQLNGFDQSAHASVRRLATKRVTLSVNDTFRQSPTTDELELNGVPFSRTGSRRNSLTASVDTRVTKFTGVSVSFDHTWVRFDKTDSLLTGGWISGGGASATRRLTERVSAGGEYGIRFAELNEGTRDLTFQDLGGLVRVALAERVTGSFAGGISYLDDRSRGEKRRGPYVRADVTQTTEYVTLGAAYERSFVPSFGFGGSAQSQQIRAFVRMPLERHRMYVQGSLGWRSSDPFLAEALPLDSTSLRSTVGYAAARHARLELFYALTRQDTRLAGGKINRQRVGAQVVISQPMRIQ